MTCSNTFYVYEHLRCDNGTPFYVGKGKGQRAWASGRARSQWWNNVASKYGRNVRIVADGLDEELALLAEIELIDAYRRKQVALVNMTIGGDGVVLTGEAKDRHRQAVSASMQDPKRKSAWSLMITSPEVAEKRAASTRAATSCKQYKQKMSENKRAYWADEKNREEQSKRRESWLLKPGNIEAHAAAVRAASGKMKATTIEKYGVKILCQETKEVFSSSTLARDWLISIGHSKASHSAIIRVCRGKKATAYGYTWCYA